LPGRRQGVIWRAASHAAGEDYGHRDHVAHWGV
jgi:hypothetical protein